VNHELNKLFALKENGKTLKTLMDDIKREFRMENAR